MARLARLSAADEMHYVRLKAKSDITLIPSQEDVGALFNIFSQAAAKTGTEIAGYVIFPDSIDMLLRPRGSAKALSSFVQSVCRLYSYYFNETYELGGSIWHGRFASSIIGADAFVLKAMVYMESLPRIRDISSPERYLWSSCRHHLGLRQTSFLSETPAYMNLGETESSRRRRYKSLLQKPVDTEFACLLEKNVGRGWPVGDAAFLSTLEADAGRIRPLRSPGRPKRESGEVSP